MSVLYHVVLVALAIGIYLVAMVLNLGIVHYERSLPSPRRTLINRLLAHRRRQNILVLTLAHGTILLVETFGAFSDLLCHAIAVPGISISVSTYLVANTIMILRWVTHVI